MFCSYFWIFSAQTFTSSWRYAHFWIIGTVIKQCHQVLAVATNNSISHLVGILNLCLVIKKIDLCCLIVKEMAKVSYHVTLPRILSTQVFSLSYIILIVWRPLREGCHQVLAVATNNSISHLVGILNLCLVIKKIDLCCLIVKEMAKVSYHVTLPRILSTQVFSLSYIILIVWRPLREGREIWNFSNQNGAYCDKNHLSMALYTLQIPNSYYEWKPPQNRQEFTCFE